MDPEATSLMRGRELRFALLQEATRAEDLGCKLLIMGLKL
jgi:hypothetical protein